MGLRRTAANALPPSFVRWLGRLQFSVAAAGPAIRWAAAEVASGESVIRHGVGAGLRFDAAGTNPGYAMGTSEAAEQRALAAHLRPGGVYYDVGANARFFTTLAGRQVGPGGRVYGFEPSPANAAAARTNAARNGFGHVTIVEAAVADRTREAAFVIDPTPTFCHLAAPGESEALAPGAWAVTVPVTTIDEAVARGELRPPDYVTIDTEGAELRVLAGMVETVRAHRPAAGVIASNCRHPSHGRTVRGNNRLHRRHGVHPDRRAADRRDVGASVPVCLGRHAGPERIPVRRPAPAVYPAVRRRDRRAH
ncbi:MAG: methyltransferase, FkbM family [Phycisphaerales bacterium]|nr:methyltransferase, FkbM family [Phycisphaerales bacterium]